MLFWIFAAVLTAAVLLLIVPPLLRSAGSAPDREEFDREVYRDQLDELERDRARGLINDAQAEAAKAEIARRMLATAEKGGSKGDGGATPRSARVLAILLALVLPVGALAVYGTVGRPDLPAQPLASRNLEQERGGPPKSVMAAMDKLKAQLAENPNDLQGWLILGQAYVKMNRNADAADALRHAVALNKDDVEIQGLFGETLVSANDGMVPEEAVTAFDAVLAKEPKDPRARFFAALARFQAGDQQGALDRWSALMADSPADAPWVPVVRDQIREAAVALNLDPAKVTPQPLPPEQKEQAQPAAPNAQANAQANGQSNAAGQDEMIRGMVANLAARLDADPSDVDGWLKLARSYGVLGEPAKALEAARKARERAPERADVQIAYANAVLQTQPRNDTPKPLPEEATSALRLALKAEPENKDALWLLGLDAMMSGRKDEAAAHWGKLIAQFKPSDPEYTLLKGRLDALKTGG
ncbi:cytochrome C biogenesis protein [Azospirillum sp. TSH100]|uniref:c-type cytochrome biogenesis protein CcmI n=1 Tax=Azospirillum sp. TSH100 TaxID=652764 RepID=UPI000D60C94B|nr:c-type cytochrome biogenesis protein CcmI [Azospirillum sp. TSH100]PWC89173.1 cytochrome C biogenesis protein [Azospirillum sp. TSH100]QCG87029.1 c-type cytochrome biogenesis protein CcmI [Azospirillum sp. TSH100]